MTLEAILRDESLRRREFPVTADKVFMAHAGVSALPARVVEAMKSYLDACTLDHQEAVVGDRPVLATRKLAAQFLGCTPQEIALLGPTSLGLSLVAEGLDWQRGENVVFYPDDYPANVYPWQALESKGVELRPIRCEKLGQICVPQIEPLVDGKTKLVALASVNFLSGYRIDVGTIGRFLRDRGVLFCLDAIQSFGALKTPLTHVDFAAADAHKWLLGPLCSGILYVRREVQDRLRPVLLGAGNVSSPNFIAQEQMRFPSHARRYEPSTLNLVGIIGLQAALELLSDVGLDAIESRVLGFGEKVISTMERVGFAFLGPRDPGARSGILSFRKADADISAIYSKLVAEKIVASHRMTRDGTQLLRLSPHFYNTESELDRLTAALG